MNRVTEAPDPGIYDGVPFEEYCAWGACHYSGLKLMGKTAAHARHAMMNPTEPTDDMEIGTATHTAILEPTRFAEQYAKAPPCDRRTKIGRALYAEFQDLHDGKKILADDDYQCAAGMLSSARTPGTLAERILSAPGKNERSFVWIDPDTGLPCKGRTDGMRIWERGTLVFDLKTAKSAELKAFSREVINRDYHAQASFYLDGLATLCDVQRRFAWIVLEKTPPYLTTVREPSYGMLASGRRLYRRWLAEFKACAESGVWPGYPDRIEEIDLPSWHKEDEPLNFDTDRVAL